MKYRILKSCKGYYYEVYTKCGMFGTKSWTTIGFHYRGLSIINYYKTENEAENAAKDYIHSKCECTHNVVVKEGEY